MSPPRFPTGFLVVPFVVTSSVHLVITSTHAPLFITIPLTLLPFIFHQPDPPYLNLVSLSWRKAPIRRTTPLEPHTPFVVANPPTTLLFASPLSESSGSTKMEGEFTRSVLFVVSATPPPHQSALNHHNHGRSPLYWLKSLVLLRSDLTSSHQLTLLFLLTAGSPVQECGFARSASYYINAASPCFAVSSIDDSSHIWICGLQNLLVAATVEECGIVRTTSYTATVAFPSYYAVSNIDGFSQRHIYRDRSLDVSFQCVIVDLQLNSGLVENHGTRYGNIKSHFLSRISFCTPTWLIVKNITSPPPRRFVTPIPSESRWYSTDICFGLNQNHLWSLNVLIVLNLSHHSSSEALCLSTVYCRVSVQRIHLAQNRDVMPKLSLFVYPSQVSRACISSSFCTSATRFQGPSYLCVNFKSKTFLLFVSSKRLDVVGARAVHARSTSYQTLPFCQINVVSDYSKLVVVTYSGTQRMLPMVSPIPE